MTEFFANAFYFLALLNPGDAAHERTVAFAERMTGRVVTTAWVLTEVGDALAAPVRRRVFLDLMDSLCKDGEIVIVPSDPALFNRGLDLLSRRPDKAWSLTDCISFVVMTDRGLAEALTGDHHFAQAGFRALLRDA